MDNPEPVPATSDSLVSARMWSPPEYTFLFPAIKSQTKSFRFGQQPEAKFLNIYFPPALPPYTPQESSAQINVIRWNIYAQVHSSQLLEFAENTQFRGGNHFQGRAGIGKEAFVIIPGTRGVYWSTVVVWMRTFDPIRCICSRSDSLGEGEKGTEYHTVIRLSFLFILELFGVFISQSSHSTKLLHRL